VQGEARQRTGFHRLLDALLDRLDELPGDDAADDLVVEHEVRLGGRPHVDLGVAVLAAAAGLPHVAALAVGLRRDRLLVGDLRLADVGADVELAQQAVGDDLEVQLAHAEISVWPVSLSVWTRKVGSSCISLPSAMPSFSWSALVLGSIDTAITGSGKFIASSTTGCLGRRWCRRW
jgi:hypothetical protein